MLKKILVSLLILFALTMVFLVVIEYIAGKLRPQSNNITYETYCRRTTPPYSEMRFARALSLLVERSSQRFNPRAKASLLMLFLGPVYNCLDVRYCTPEKMAGADGLFFFDSKNANREGLLICVSPEYRAEDDLLTTLLLAHESVHAIQFVMDEVGQDRSSGSYNKSCYGDEAAAFSEEILFTMSLTDGEIDSLMSRIDAYGQQNQRISMIGDFLNVAMQEAQAFCVHPEYTIIDSLKCLADRLPIRLERDLRQSPYYQNQCRNN